jgi:hypothetical protein
MKLIPDPYRKNEHGSKVPKVKDLMAPDPDHFFNEKKCSVFQIDTCKAAKRREILLAISLLIRCTSDQEPYNEEKNVNKLKFKNLKGKN